MKTLNPAWPALSTLTVALVAGATLVLGGCANPGGIAPVAQPLDTARFGLAASPTPAASAAFASTAPDGSEWWRAYGDAQLDRLIAQALADSPSLRAAQARLQRAQAAAQTVRAADGPQVQAGADTTREHFSANSIYPAPLGGSIRTLANVQLGASWEFDFFGRNRAALAAAIGQGRAAEAELQSARNVLAAAVARQYAQLARLGEQRRIAERALAQRREMLALIQQRVQAGLDTTVELRQGEGALPDTRGQIEQIDEQMALVRHALAALTAQAPGALQGLQAALPAKGAALPAAIPADLLGRRADIAAARWRVEAATQDVAAARAAFYPNVNLSAFAGFSSIGLDHLLKAASQQYGVGPAIHLPVFDSGRLRANLRGRSADLDAAVEAYNGAVLEALHETADPIASLQALARQQAEQTQAQAAAEASYDLALQRYRAGLGTHLIVLNAESAVLAQRRAAADLRARLWDAQIALAKALGGGFNAEAPTTVAQR